MYGIAIIFFEDIFNAFPVISFYISINHHAHPIPLNLEVKIGQIFHDMDTDKDFFISTTEISFFFAVYDLDNLDGIREFQGSWMVMVIVRLYIPPLYEELC